MIKKVKKISKIISELTFSISLALLGKFDASNLLLEEYQLVVTVFWVSGLLFFVDGNRRLQDEVIDVVKDFFVAVMVIPLGYIISGDAWGELFEPLSVIVHFVVFMCIILFAKIWEKSIGKMAYYTQAIIPIIAILLIRFKVSIIWAFTISVFSSYMINFWCFIRKKGIENMISNLYNFRECDDAYLERRKKRYANVAMEVQKIIHKCGYEECEESFELAKKWMINNQKLSFLTTFIDAGREILVYASNWIPVVVSFALGILTEKVSDNFAFILDMRFWGVFLGIFSIGFVADLVVKIICTKIEKPNVLILDEMTFAQYKLLIRKAEETEESCIAKPSE